MNRNNTMLELMETPATGKQIAGQHSEEGIIHFSRRSEEAPVWYDSCGDIAAWENLSLCVNG